MAELVLMQKLKYFPEGWVDFNFFKLLIKDLVGFVVSLSKVGKIATAKNFLAPMTASALVTSQKSQIQLTRDRTVSQ
jgi:hypothetical protein